ncbi:hypothetical protein M422DRAFT_257523 [Sphaerobolus stellatus SS14]|uniref:Uncharacterized protein n=1 Tax=Sphaerobolus stellatus (strain SS14) TaxID=990650 RepID=A0A0C9UXS6_SPHS4|nr:hypothetical protein M422DRAFT_257523 [Sphaerobolus stellatus SS14]
MARPIKHQTAGERRAAKLKAQRKWNESNKEYLREKALKRYHETRDSKPPRKTFIDNYMAQAVDEFHKTRGIGVLVPLYKEFCRIAAEKPGEEGFAILYELKLHTKDASVQAIRIQEEAHRHDPSCSGNLSTRAVMVCKDIERAHNFYHETLLWYKVFGLEKLKESVLEGKLVWALLLESGDE